MVTFSLATVLLVKFATVVCMNNNPISNGSAQTISTEQVCVVSNNSLNMTEIEGRCFLACVSEKFRDESGMWNYSLSIYWPFVTRTNCATSSNLYQCTVGCVRSQHLSHLEVNLDCRINCLNHCNDLKSSLMCDGLTPLCHPWSSEECQITCNIFIYDNNNPCYKGCMLEDELPKKQNQSQIPFTPIGPPRLIPVQNTDSAGQSIFIVDLSGTIPELQDCDSANKNDISPVAFLFKFEDVNSHNISFNWTENPFALLNLTGYACQELQVSFAVGNIAGLSEFSQPALIKLNRNETMVSILNSPVNLTVLTETVDTRIGFFGHVILNISWDVPQEYSHLDYYMITVTTAAGFNMTMCGCKTWSRKVQFNESFLSIEAESVESLPLISCSYDIQIYSVGHFGSSYPTRNTYAINTTFDVQSAISFECQRLWQNEGISFNLTWVLSPYYLPGLSSAISSFVVDFKLKDETNNITCLIDNTTITFPQDGEIIIMNISNIDHNLNNTFLKTLLVEKSWNFHLESSVTWNISGPYVPPKHINTCVESSFYQVPSLVEDLNITSCTINGSNISIEIEWSPPSVIIGKLYSYDICIGNVSLVSDQEIPKNGSHKCSNSSKEQLYQTLINYNTESNNSQVYVQIRGKTMHGTGNWSEPQDVFCICPHDQRVGVPTIIGVSLSSFLVALIILFLLIGLAVWIIKKLQRRKKVYRTVQGPHDPIFSGGMRNFHLQWSLQMSLQNLDRWEISSKDIITKDLLGEGVFGEVYRGIIKCPIVNPKVWSSDTKKTIYTPVAIKRLKPSAQANERKDFLSEIEIMKKVAEGQNPHVVGLLGCVTIQEPLCLITEFVKYGDLLSYLRINRRMCIGSNTEEDDNDDAYLELGNVSPVDLVSFAYQITSGMEYLSSLGIVHRDLASRNILVDEGKVLKITDFGLSRETDEIYVQKRTGRVPLKWMAIESIIAREFTSASDVWSFGVVLWEIGTLGGIPFPNIQNDDLLLQLKGGYRMEKPDNCSPEVYDIMLMCWKDQPKERPTFKELRAKFDAMLLAEKKNTYITLSGIDESKSYYQSLPPVITLDLPIRKLASSKVSTVSLDETLSTGRKKESDLTRFRNSLLSLQDQQSQSESRYVQSPMKEVGSSPALSPTL